MNESVFFILILLCTLGAGLMAGVFFAFSVFVMNALARLPAAQGIAAMQAINVAVLNWVFLGVFFGTGAASAIATLIVLTMSARPGAAYVVIGAVVYAAGCIGVTMFCNVPRNDALARLAPVSTDGASYWPHYVREWTAWNHVRTLACLAAMVAFIVGMMAR